MRSFGAVDYFLFWQWPRFLVFGTMEGKPTSSEVLHNVFQLVDKEFLNLGPFWAMAIL